MCKGTDADGQIVNVSFAEMVTRCAADSRCAGFANMTTGCGPTSRKCGYRPVTSVAAIDAHDAKWNTWKKHGFTPPPAPPPSPPNPPPSPTPTPRSWQVWKRRLADGSVASAFLNRGTQNQTITVTLSELGIASSGGVHARDLFLQKDLGAVTTSSFTVALPGFGSKAVKFTPKTRIVCDNVPWYHSTIVQQWPHYLRTYVQLDCGEDEQIVHVRFASLGVPRGECGGERSVDPACHMEGSREVVERACLGQQNCVVESKDLDFITGTCGGEPDMDARLAVEVECGAHK